MEKSHQSDGLIIDLSNQAFDSSIFDNLLDKVKNHNFFGDIKWPENMPVSKYQKQIEEIESELIKNNESFRMFPNDYVHCFISNKVYDDLKENQPVYIQNENWKVYKVFNIPNIDTTDEKDKKKKTKKGSIYSGAVFVNEKKKQIVLAHRGININVYNFNNKIGPLEMNIEGILRNEYIPQLCYCYEITTKVNEIAKEKDYNLSFTGYSNGAWLAEYSIYFSKRFLENDNVKAVLFESPGMLKDEGQFLSNNILSPENDFDLKELNTINYLTVPHLMNCSNKHTGKVYRLFVETNNKKDEEKLNFLEKFISGIKELLKKKMETTNIGFFLKGLYSMFNNDYLELMIEQFDPKTGKPKYCEQMINWPLIHFEFAESYQKNFKKKGESIIENAIDYIPFIGDIKLIKSISTKILNEISSFFIDFCAKKLMPGLHLLFNVLFEILSKEMVDLSLFENDIYNKKYNELDERKDNQESNIELRYQNNNDKNKEKTSYKRMFDFIFNKKKRNEEKEKKKEIERRIEINENKFTLVFKNDFEPIILNENIKVLRIDSDSREIDWCLFNLKYLKSNNQKNLVDKFPSKLVYKQLINLLETFKIETRQQDYVSCRDINVIFSLNENLTIADIKDRFRLFLKMYQNNIKNLLSDSSKIQVKILMEKNLRSDVVDFFDTTYYLKRNEDKIIEEIINEKKKNIFILSEVGGIGKTTMAKFIVKQLNENYEFVVKVIDTYSIEDEYKRILENDFCYFEENFKDKNLIDLITNEFTTILDLNKDLKVLLLVDNVKNDVEILTYIGRLPKHLKILITTRKNDLLEDIIDKKVFGKEYLKSFGVDDAKKYFLNRSEINNNFNSEKIDEFIKKLMNIKIITPLRLELAAKFISNSIENLKETNDIMENLKSGVSDMEFTELIIKSLENDDQTIEFLYNISFLDNSFISIDTIKFLINFGKIEDIVKKLEKNGIVKIKRINDNPGIEIHDIILDMIENKIKNNLKSYQIIQMNIITKMNENIGNIQEIKNDDWIKMEKNKKHIRKIFEKYQPEEKNSVDLNILQLFKKLADYTIYSNQYDDFYFYSWFDYVGSVYKNMGKYAIALEFYSKSLIMFENSNQPEHPDFAMTFNNIGSVYNNMGYYQEALDYYKLSLKIYEKIYSNQPDQADLASTINNIGSVYNNMGKFDEALEYYGKSLIIYEKIYSNQPDHPEFVSTFNNIGSVYNNKGEYDKSLEFYYKSLKINEKIHSNQPDHPSLVSSFNNIGSIYANMGIYDKSLEFYYKSLKIYINIYSKQCDIDSPFYKICLVDNYINTFDKALEFLENIYSNQPDQPDFQALIKKIRFVYQKAPELNCHPNYSVACSIS